MNESDPKSKQVVIINQWISLDAVLTICIAAVLIALISNGYTCDSGGCHQ